MPAATDSFFQLVKDAERFLRTAHQALERALLDDRDVEDAIRDLDPARAAIERRFDAEARSADEQGKLFRTPGPSAAVAEARRRFREAFEDLVRRARAAQARRGKVDARWKGEYNKLVVNGLKGVRGRDPRDDARRLVRDLVGKALPREVDESAKDEIARALATEILKVDAVDEAFLWAQDVLIQVSGYVQKRVTFAPRIKEIAETTSGKAVPPPHLAGVQDGLTQQAQAARALDERIKQDLERSRWQANARFTLNPSLVLDPTVRFVKQVDAKFGVTITKNDVIVRLSTGFTLERPLMPDAGLKLQGGVDVQLGRNTTLQLGVSQNVRDLYRGPKSDPASVYVGIQIRF